MTIRGFESGCHVLCEKPLAMTSEEAGSMLDASRRADRLLGCCSNRFLGHHPNAEVAAIVATGRIREPYHVTWIDRRPTQRTGIDYQPQTRWFLDRSKSGGGVLMDRGPYDFATLGMILQPTSIEVHAATTAQPELGNEPEGVVNNVEQHVVATLRYTLPDGGDVTVSYERAAGTHGREERIAEVEGTRGSVRWWWLGYQDKDGTVDLHTTLDGGVPLVDPPTNPPPHPAAMPLVQFLKAVRGEENLAILGERAVFNFRCLRAVYECEETGQRQRVELAMV